MLGISQSLDEAHFLLLHINRFKKRPHYGKTAVFKKLGRKTSLGKDLKPRMTTHPIQQTVYLERIRGCCK